MQTIWRMSPRISVILPTYNRARTLERAILSVLNQTFTDFELIVVDDGSTDGTKELLRKFDGRDNVRTVFGARRGASAARNLGVKEARGEYVAFQDSDDEWLPHKLARAIETLGLPGNEDCVFYSHMKMCQMDGRSREYQAPVIVEGRFLNERTGDFEMYGVSMQTLVLKKKHYEAVGGCDEAIPRFIDLELCLRLGDRCRFVLCPESLCNVYIGRDEIRISMNGQARVDARRHMIQKYRKRLSRPSHHLARQYLYLAHAQSLNGNALESMLTAVKAWWIAPTRVIIVRGMFSVFQREISKALKAGK